MLGESFPTRASTVEVASAIAPTDGAASIGLAPTAATTTTSPSTAAPILFSTVAPIDRQATVPTASSSMTSSPIDRQAAVLAETSSTTTA